MTFRLMEMGLIEGACVEVVGRAPLGDPLHVRLGDYELSLRREEAELVDIVGI
jgi:Fe2+ transport system protein FeoA